MVNMSLFDKCFITGCDSKTEWMLPWFIKNYNTHINTPLVFADFGCSSDMLAYVNDNVNTVLDMTHLSEKGWFKKPATIAKIASLVNSACWIDTDFEILQDMGDVFNYFEPSKLNMVEDLPWSKRRGETWHNSGLVGVSGNPKILNNWVETVRTSPIVGDQEVLHSMLKSPLDRIIYINTLPNEYNWLRLQLFDGHDSNKKRAIHWTGPKGKEEIMRQMEKIND